MANEKKWLATGPYSVVSSGTSDGKLTLSSALGLHVKQRIQLRDPILPEIALEIKKVTGAPSGSTTIFPVIEVGRVGAPLLDRVDVSSYGLTSSVFAPEQNRNAIPLNEIQRQIYEEEPAVAQREVLVDSFGQHITPDNPLPVAPANGLVKQPFDKIINSFDAYGNVTQTQYFYKNILVSTVTLTYDAFFNITQAVTT
jgi:hypothetical protein